MFKNKYRIVKSIYCSGIYKAETKKWWFPFFWFQFNFSYLFHSVKATEDYIDKYKEKIKIKNRIKEFISTWKELRKRRKDRIVKYVE